jgi:hypothetical protein
MIYIIRINKNDDVKEILNFIHYLGYPLFLRPKIKTKYIILYDTIKDIDLYDNIPLIVLKNAFVSAKGKKFKYNSIFDFKKMIFRKRLKYENNK